MNSFMDLKGSKWVKQIIELQHEDGSWGCFHTLRNPTKEQPLSTEQALRRLAVLGLTHANKDTDGQWDFGTAAKDGGYLPISDSWRKAEDRKADCTERIAAFLQKLDT